MENFLITLIIQNLLCHAVVAPNDLLKTAHTIDAFVYFDTIVISESPLPAGTYLDEFKDIYNGTPYSCSVIKSMDVELRPFYNDDVK